MLPRRAFRFAFGAFLAVVPAFVQRAVADTFTSYVVATSAGSISNYGLTTSGTLVVSNTALGTYTAFTPPSTSMTTTTPPALVYDNGASCTPTNTGAFSSVSTGWCNGGFEVFQATVGTGMQEKLYDGPDPLANLVSSVANGGYDNFLINSVGDIAAVAVDVPSAGLDQNLFLVRATPEPSSIALLGTGVLGVAGMVRRRYRAGAETI